MTTPIRPLLAAGLAGAFALGACGPTEYEPAASPSDTGYEATQLAEGRYLVSFEGNAATSRERVETYLLYRAAQLAEEQGSPYFEIVEGDTEREVDVNPYYTQPGLYGYGPGFGWGAGYVGAPYTTVSPYAANAMTTDSYEAYATVELLDQATADRPGVLETSTVISTLRPRIERPD